MMYFVLELFLAFKRHFSFQQRENNLWKESLQEIKTKFSGFL